MKENYLNREELNKLIEEVAKYIYNGIMVDDKKIFFSLIDYYSLTDIDIFYIYSIIAKDNSKISNEQKMYRDIFMRFYNLEGCMYYIVKDPEEILLQKISFYVNKERREITREDVIEIFEILDAHNIPKYNKLVFTALNRKLNGLPVLPLLEREKEKTL